MNEAIATAVIVIGLLIGLGANYLAWSWILGIRRRTRVRRLARADGSPPESELDQSVAGSGDRARESR